MKKETNPAVRVSIKGAFRPFRHFAFAKYAYPHKRLMIFTVKTAEMFDVGESQAKRGRYFADAKSLAPQNRNPPSGCQKKKHPAAESNCTLKIENLLS